jgi:hypothetical protein
MVNGIVEMTVNIAFVFVVRLVRAENRRTFAACKMFQVEFLADSINVGASQGLAAFSANQIQSFEIVSFA